MREIDVPGLNLSKEQARMIINYNDEILISHCKDKKPAYGLITPFGIIWRSLNDLYMDAEGICYYFFQTYILYLPDKRIIAPSHADEIFNQKLNPFVNKPIQS